MQDILQQGTEGTRLTLTLFHMTWIHICLISLVRRNWKNKYWPTILNVQVHIFTEMKKQEKVSAVVSLCTSSEQLTL